MTHTCTSCGEPLKRVYSEKKEKHYWFCLGPEDQCGEVFQDDEGEPVLDGVRKGKPDPNEPCPSCGKPMQKITGTKNGDFLSCSDYPECKTSIDLIEGIKAPLCKDDSEHGHMRLRNGKNGKFFSCSHYPDCRSVIDYDRWERANLPTQTTETTDEE